MYSKIVNAFLLNLKHSKNPFFNILEYWGSLDFLRKSFTTLTTEGEKCCVDNAKELSFRYLS